MTLTTKSAAAEPRGWLTTLKVYLEPASVHMLLLVLGTLSFWLREAGIDCTTIGYLSWVGLAYAFKWVWAPQVDCLPMVWRALDTVRIEQFGHSADAAGRSSRRVMP